MFGAIYYKVLSLTHTQLDKKQSTTPKRTTDKLPYTLMSRVRCCVWLRCTTQNDYLQMYP